ncbi:MAG: DNA replication/repair protein RecF [Eubacteriales bacterium]|nr:DNA replication/repair protein RecF [Eubacteriales bacterium]
MYLENLVLKNYRNYETLNVRFQNGINILQGKNAAGKTNVLEAIGFLSYGKSFRTQKDTECIKDGCEAAYIKGGIMRTQGQLSVEALLSRQDKKSLKVSGQPARKMGELFGNFIAVVFSPEDIKVLKESPALRRRFIDMEISKLRPIYFYDLQEYYKALAQKNALLRSRMKQEQLGKLVSVYNEQLAQHGEKIILQRRSFLQRIEELSRAIHRDLSAGETLSLRYKSSVKSGDIRQTLYDKMEKSLASEIEQGFCLYGPHREDIAVSLDNSEIKAYSSQGQIRTAMLSLKLATLDVASADFGESPVLLLDDVFSELDEARQAALLSRIKDTQCFITTAVPMGSVAGAVYTVENGMLKS